MLNNLAFHVVVHYYWWIIDEKNELILWKLSVIWIKILNNIAYNLNWIRKFKFILNTLNGIQIQLPLDSFGFQLNEIQIQIQMNRKYDAN
jgi:hypothetical protein